MSSKICKDVSVKLSIMNWMVDALNGFYREEIRKPFRFSNTSYINNVTFIDDEVQYDSNVV